MAALANDIHDQSCSPRAAAKECICAMYHELIVDNDNPYKFALTLPFYCEDDVEIEMLISLPIDYPAALILTPSLKANFKVPNSIEDSLRAAVAAFAASRRTGDADADAMLICDVLAFVQGNDDGDGDNQKSMQCIVESIASMASSATSKANSMTDVSLASLASLDAMDALSMSKSWHHSEQFTSKGSVFVGSGALIDGADEVLPLVRSHSNQDSRHRKATHHMYAYRILRQDAGRTIIQHDNGDDGEDGAGRKLAILLENMIGSELPTGRGELGVLLIVSRWYGGVKLGPKRFHHISSVGRDVIMKMDLGIGR